jgi:hypothetical protein
MKDAIIVDVALYVAAVKLVVRRRLSCVATCTIYTSFIHSGPCLLRPSDLRTLLLKTISQKRFGPNTLKCPSNKRGYSMAEIVA